MKIKALHLSFGGSLHWHRPTATTSRYSQGMRKEGRSVGQKGQQTGGQMVQAPGGCRELQGDAGSSISLAKPPSSH